MGDGKGGLEDDDDYSTADVAEGYGVDYNEDDDYDDEDDGEDEGGKNPPMHH